MILQVGAAVVTILLNGSVVHSYRPAVIENGRVSVPVSPYVAFVAAGAQCDGRMLTVRRGDYFVQVPIRSGYVQIAPVLRTLGVPFSFDPRSRRLFVYLARAAPLATPTPFNGAVPQVPPRAVFTPVPVHTDAPRVTGVPRPRRTPLPVSASPKP